MESEAQILLDDAIAFCQRDGQSDRLVNMLSQSTPVELDDESLYIEAPSRFAVAFLEKNRSVVEAYLEEIAFMPISLVVQAPAGSHTGAVRPTIPAAPAAASQDTSVMATTEVPRPHQNNAMPEASAANAAIAANAAGVDMPQMAAPHMAVEPVEKPIENPFDLEAAFAKPRVTVESDAAGFATAPGPMSFAPAGEHGGVNVTNTMSRDQFNRMFAQMKGVETGQTVQKKSIEPAGRGAPMAGASDQPVANPIGSKFTFDNFVYGDENKLAYHSAMRFAAFADEPGQYNSLFIYGGSGLGKTHLLLAIKNHLAANKPHIKVKYANSQAYIDDFINEIARQKTEGRAILREYHEANVLIIDDIQNIIGKQASIEYFFSLMDEFIRENKKVVIASDRAPKNLGMDERLTSRFNAGMLCLVSEPGFEMKYMILKRYYENTIKGGDDLNGMNVDPSLLGAFQTNDGTLTDEQLRHMAEISGNNIRELESYCERCASLSFEREQQGGELTTEDIEKVANEYFDTARKIIRIDTVQKVVADFYHLQPEDLKGTRRTKEIAFARHVAVYLSNSLCEMTSSAIGAEFGGRDHSTVLNSLKVVESKIKEDRRICDDLQKLKNKIVLQSQS
ncbi:chromosomal replication initiator protein DnaA [Collinsella tanakaei]|uniref:chromosomal replication initiator protein DnaA n=1 Tax=Collinsella tanakaei TaxID=626935 RepID=UPI00265B34A4|nr:chromosomal replication initiator protein DnaA [Collinsella tanakaei]